MNKQCPENLNIEFFYNFCQSSKVLDFYIHVDKNSIPSVSNC